MGPVYPRSRSIFKKASISNEPCPSGFPHELQGEARGSSAPSTATALSNGNYVVDSRYWDNGAVVDVGAATWGNGTTGITGTVSTANSLVGSLANDQVGYLAVALSNGNYVVRAPNWDNGAAADAGAATWGSGTTGVIGTVSAANSLVGSTKDDHAGSDFDGYYYYGAITVLTSGNYLVRSPFWANEAASNAGAVTWGNGLGGTTGPVSAANSLVGASANDYIGEAEPGIIGVIRLSNGNYVVGSSSWDNGTATDAGAVTWGNGLGGTVDGVAKPALYGDGSGGTYTVSGQITLAASSDVGNYKNNGMLTLSGRITGPGGLVLGKALSTLPSKDVAGARAPGLDTPVERYFAGGQVRRERFAFETEQDWDAFLGSLCSASYTPDEDDAVPRDERRERALEDAEHAEARSVGKGAAQTENQRACPDWKREQGARVLAWNRAQDVAARVVVAEDHEHVRIRVGQFLPEPVQRRRQEPVDEIEVGRVERDGEPESGRQQVPAEEDGRRALVRDGREQLLVPVNVAVQVGGEETGRHWAGAILPRAARASRRLQIVSSDSAGL